MKRVESVIATTFVDSHGEQLTCEALKSLVESMSKSLIPVGVEHDPRIPPLGRLSSGFVRQREDGEHEAVGIMEMFEDHDDLIADDDEREIVLPKYRSHGLHITHDWAHRLHEDQEDIAAISKVFGNPPLYEVKKAADPISIITICGAFALGGIASGFLKEIGSDGWKLVKTRLAMLFARQKKDNGDRLLSFSVVLDIDSVMVEIDIIHTNPSPEEVTDFLEKGLTTVESVLPFYLQNAPDIRRLVFEAKGSDIEVKFAVRKDCRALVPSLSVQEIIERSRKEEAAIDSSNNAV